MSDTAIAAIVQENVSRVRAEIAAACRRVGRNPDDVTLIGVTKSVGRPLADALIATGVHDIAENRVQDAMEKFGRRDVFPPLPVDVRLHMIGNLQTNKARDVVGLCPMIHSVNRTAIADALQREAARQQITCSVLLEVNAAYDDAKQGVDPSGVAGLMGYVVNNCANLHLLGLMTIAPLVATAEETRPTFRSLRLLRDMLVQEHPAQPLPLLSMGMSNDFPIAIEEGATHVRIGRALFVGLPSPA
ncbi:MAG: YggS family pyridoxal phosphate-dependent enzyme [Chloroflexota bacterium]|nr:YggS family pyridoxal phosphate-dependent enzyme [Chloroflexota bacterium]